MRPFRRSRVAVNADASPSISLERGGYRMRAPRLTSAVTPLVYGKGSTSRQPTRSHPIGVELKKRNLVSLLALLTISCICCFTFAYYLFTSRWEHNSWKDPFAQADGSVKALALDRRNRLPHNLLANEKYLAYLPHSGFHNQRIALENALTLACLLNRTLLVPPVRFGVRAIRYLPFHTLYDSLELSTSEGLEHCGEIPHHITLPIDCLDYFDTAILAWEDLFDFSELKKQQGIMHLKTMSPSEYTDTFFLLSVKVMQIRDGTPYQYQFVDTDNTASLPSKYDESISLSDLSRVPHDLLQLGTLFGTNRLLLGGAGSTILDGIRKKMVIRHETLNTIAESIYNRMPHPYIGLHLRVGDGNFSERREGTIRRSWCLLLYTVGYTTQHIPGVLQLSGTRFLFNSSMEDVCPPNPNDVIHKFQPIVSRAYNGKHSSSSRSQFRALATPIFLSTDLKHPKTHPLLQPLWQTFPCLFFSSDFPKEIQPLHSIKNSDGVALYTHLLPFVEAMVVARAVAVVGTQGSTFSKFIEGTLWPSYHQSNSKIPFHTYL